VIESITLTIWYWYGIS